MYVAIMQPMYIFQLIISFKNVHTNIYVHAFVHIIAYPICQ